MSTIRVVFKTYHEVEFDSSLIAKEQGGEIEFEPSKIGWAAMHGEYGEPLADESVLVQVFNNGEEVYCNV